MILDREGSGVAPLTLGGVRARELAQTYGTPLGIIDLGMVDRAISAVKAACAPHGVRISYAGKAFITVEFARFLARYGIGLDVCSLGELAVAERAGFPRERITLHGAGKTAEELQAALDGRVGRVVVDGLDELRSLCSASCARPLDVVLRLNTGIEAHAHEYLQTSGNRSKFGMPPNEEEEACELLDAALHLRLRGLHGHVGSQIYDSAAFAANGEALVDAAARFTSRGHGIDRIIVGGGFGIPERPCDEVSDIAAVIADVAAAVEHRARERGIAEPRIEIEPGRSIVAQAGTTLYRVMAVKRQGDRTFAIVDGGMGDNPRPALYDAYHHVVSADGSTAGVSEVTVCGRTCESDVLATVMLPNDIAAGQLLAMQNTGAYTHSMASNYNRFARPAVVGVRDGSHRLLVRRETIDDMLRTDV